MTRPAVHPQAREDRLKSAFNKAPPPPPDDEKRLAALAVAAADCFFDKDSAQQILNTFDTRAGRIGAVAHVRAVAVQRVTCGEHSLTPTHLANVVHARSSALGLPTATRSGRSYWQTCQTSQTRRSWHHAWESCSSSTPATPVATTACTSKCRSSDDLRCVPTCHGRAGSGGRPRSLGVRVVVSSGAVGRVLQRPSDAWAAPAAARLQPHGQPQLLAQRDAQWRTVRV